LLKTSEKPPLAASGGEDNPNPGPGYELKVNQIVGESALRIRRIVIRVDAENKHLVPLSGIPI
jgi:hypothetical protein